MAVVGIPPDELVGLDLPDKPWRVVKKIGRDIDATGGYHSYGYVVANKDGDEAILKVFDFSQARAAPDDVFNHTQFSTVDTNVKFDKKTGAQANPLFGQFTASRLPRRMQLALRITF
jgi:hypothetical protein